MKEKFRSIFYWIKIVFNCKFNTRKIAENILDHNGYAVKSFLNQDGTYSSSRGANADFAVINLTSRLWSIPLLSLFMMFTFSLIFYAYKIPDFSSTLNSIVSIFALIFVPAMTLVILPVMLFDVNITENLKIAKFKTRIHNEDGSVDVAKTDWLKDKNTLCFIKQDDSYHEIKI